MNTLLYLLSIRSHEKMSEDREESKYKINRNYFQYYIQHIVSYKAKLRQGTIFLTSKTSQVHIHAFLN